MALFFPGLWKRKIIGLSWKRSLKKSSKRFSIVSKKIRSLDRMGGQWISLWGLYDIIGKDILRVVEESRINGYIHSPLNATFIALIPKKDDPQSLEDFRPISLCNNIYKVVSKIISRRLKPFLSNSVSQEQFGFLEGRQIHEAIGVAQEALHSIKYREDKRGNNQD
jgi:hypothetical protein